MTIPIAVPSVIRPRRTSRVRTVRVALAGCGVVGGELVRLLAQGEREIHERFGLRFRVVRVLVRGSARARPPELAPELLTTRVDDFLATDAHVVVEAIGGLDPALGIARATLAAGRRLVTANKALVAAHGPELMRLARRGGGRFDFESAVAGGIPVLRVLRDQLPGTRIRSIRGILNGTTNYILTRIAEGVPYRAALAEAQAKGYAEANPSRDLSGEDAADKVRILAWLTFGVDPAALAVRTRGILPDPDRLAADAAALGGVPRLAAECLQLDGHVVASVEPAIVRPDSLLGQVRGEDNLVVIESHWNGTLRLAGPGAGGGPTASALLGDLVRGARFHPPRPALSLEATRADPLPHRWLISVMGDGETERLLLRTLERAEVHAAAPLRAPDALRVLTGPAPWAKLDLVARMLEAGLARPLVSRAENAAECG